MPLYSQALLQGPSVRSIAASVGIAKQGNGKLRSRSVEHHIRQNVVTESFCPNAVPLLAPYLKDFILYVQVLGKDVNLGRHISEDAAAKAYDKAAICARGKYAAKLNFALDEYSPELERLEAMTVAELAPVLRQAYMTFGLPSG